MNFYLMTRYLGPTNTKGSRVKVYGAPNVKPGTYSFDYAARSAHESAVWSWLAREYGPRFDPREFNTVTNLGPTPDGNGQVYLIMGKA